jgi:ribonucleoside-diphosphate reductase alpha chain
MTEKMNIIKRSGQKVPLEIEKWQAHIAKMCEGISNVSTSMIELMATPEFRDGMTTRDLDEVTLRAMANLIDEETLPDIGDVNYQFVAGKQRVTMLRKDVYGSFEPPRLYEIVKKNVGLGLYTKELLEWYTEAEWDQIDSFIDHDRDLLMPFASIDQMVSKYLIRNRSTGVIVETPQIRYAVAAATNFHAETTNRMGWVRDYYDESSTGSFSTATPVIGGLGTPTKQFSSCVVIRTNDTLKSIFATGQVMADYASKRAGIGLEIGRLRPLGAPIRGGEIAHTGTIPFLKKWYGDLRSCCLTPDTWVEILDEET